MNLLSGILLSALAVFAAPPQDDPAVAGWIAKLTTAENEAAIAALAKAGRPAVAPLIAVLESGQRDVAWQGMRALRGLAGKADSGKARLVAILRNGGLPSWRRALAAAALGSMPSDAVTAVDSLVAALHESPISELQILSACALVEIGEPSGAALGRELTNKDREVGLWAANLLVELGTKATKAKLPLQRLVESEKKGDDGLFFLLQPSIASASRAIGSPYKEPENFNDLLRILKESKDKKKYADFPYQFHGGVLPIEMMKDPARARELLKSSFDLGKDDPSFAIDLPKSFEDSDRNDEFSTGELVQGIGNHLAIALHPVRQRLETDAIVSWEQWLKDSAEVRGLLLAIHVLTRPEFLTRSRCLEGSTTRFVGLYPSDK